MNIKNDELERLAINYLNNLKSTFIALLEESDREGYTTADQFKKSINNSLDFINEKLKKYKGAGE